MANRVGPMGSYLGRTAPSVVYGQESACHMGDLGSIPGLGTFPEEGNRNPLQYFCLEDFMDRGAWQASVPWTQVLNSSHHRAVC